MNALLQFSEGYDRLLCAVTRPLHQALCRRYGLVFISEAITTTRLRMVREALIGADEGSQICVLSADVLWIDPAKSLLDEFPPDCELAMATDGNGYIDLGAIWLRNTHAVRLFLDLALETPTVDAAIFFGDRERASVSAAIVSAEVQFCALNTSVVKSWSRAPRRCVLRQLAAAVAVVSAEISVESVHAAH